MLTALVTVICLALVFVIANGPKFLMPGPLSSAHGTIERCSTCHSKSGSRKLSFMHGLIAGDPLADSKACLTCHKMPNTAFNAHGASVEVLKQSTQRLQKIVAETPQPQSARAQSFAFPTHDMVARGLYCATCHQEHQGVNFDLGKISNEQCRSCHVVKFDSFEGHHPKFENYPFARRTRIIYDHAAHFAEHFPEVAKKDPARRIPATCSTCHDSHEDRRAMSVSPFDRTCASCHLDQIIGKERVSGPKGIAFLALPGLDLETLKKKKAIIGEWPEASEAELTPFMQVMISRNERGRALIETVGSLNLQELGEASDDQIKAVASLAWEIKDLLYTLIKGKASDALGDIDIGGGAKLSAALVADLTANIPRDVLTSAQQQWLPNLATEIADRPAAGGEAPGGWSTTIKESGVTGSASAPVQTASDVHRAQSAGRAEAGGNRMGAARGAPDDGKQSGVGKSLPPPMRAGIEVAQVARRDAGEETGGATPPDSGEQMIAAEDRGGAITRRWSLPSGTPRAIEARSKKAGKKAEPAAAVGNGATASSKSKVNNKARSDGEPPEAQPKAAGGATGADKADADTGKETRATDKQSQRQPQAEATEQTDDLLFPTNEELRAMKSGGTESAEPAAAAGAADAANATSHASDSSADAAAATDVTTSSDTAAPTASAPQARAAPVINIESDVDPESWAEYGGWYRQDYAIFYRPTGHKDKFLYSWLTLAGPQAHKGDKAPAAAVFNYLTSKDAQGSCTKCHSVDEAGDKGRLVNFTPQSAAGKRGRFTNFIHEPHFGVMENRGCLTCHALEKGRPYLKTYEQGDPLNFVSGFGTPKKELCQSCHASSMARQDCLLCHKYHVNGVVTPIISTKIPSQ